MFSTICASRKKAGTKRKKSAIFSPSKRLRFASEEETGSGEDPTLEEIHDASEFLDAVENQSQREELDQNLQNEMEDMTQNHPIKVLYIGMGEGSQHCLETFLAANHG